MVVSYVLRPLRVAFCVLLFTFHFFSLRSFAPFAVKSFPFIRAHPSNPCHPRAMFSIFIHPFAF